MSLEDSTDELLTLLGGEHVRQILAATSRKPLSAKELSEVCDVAQSTIYRRVEDMVSHDLLVERTQLDSDGTRYSVYEAKVERLTVEISDGTIDVNTNVRKDAAERFSRIWSDIRET